MLTIEEAERHIVAASFDRDTCKKINLDWVENESGKSVLKALKLLHNRGEKATVTAVQLELGKMNESINESFLKQLMSKFVGRGQAFDDLTKDYMSILMARRNKKLLLSDIERARGLIEADRFNEAIAILKGLTFTAAGHTQNALFWMFDAMTSTSGFRSGFSEIDTNGALLRKNMMTIAGDSGSQKTMFAQAMMIRMLRENPEFKAVFFEKEMPLEDLGRRIASFILKEDSNTLMYEISQARDIAERADKMIELREKVNEKLSDNGELKSIIDRLELVSRDDFQDALDIWQIVAQRKPDIWTLDFFTMLEPKQGGIDDDNMRREAITLKNCLLDTNSFGLVLSQLKQSVSVDQRANKVPMIGDMEWGKHLRQYSTWVFSIFYPAYYGLTVSNDQWFFLVSRKTRHGRSMIIPLFSDPSIASFREPNKTEYKEMISYIRKYMERGNNSDQFGKRFS